MKNGRNYQNVPIDIGIITYNRDDKLFRCVSYILSGALLPKKIIIVHCQSPDNCKSKKKITLLCRRVGVDLNYIHVPQKGISFSRNRVLKEVTSPIFGFIDDDEYPSENWIRFVHEFFSAHKNIDVLTGPKIPSNMQNYWNQLWYEVYRSSLNHVGPAQFITSGNSFFRTDRIREKSITFDNDFRESSEDLVFSFLLRKYKLRMQFHSGLVEYHDFRDTMLSFYLQWCGYGKSMAIFEKKYNLLRPKKFIYRLWQLLPGFRLLRIERPRFWIGLIIMDIVFSLGFVKGLAKRDM